MCCWRSRFNERRRAADCLTRGCRRVWPIYNRPWRFTICPTKGRSRNRITGSSRYRRGRDSGYPLPPAQTRACGATAHGSYFGYATRGWLASKSRFVQGVKDLLRFVFPCSFAHPMRPLHHPFQNPTLSWVGVGLHVVLLSHRPSLHHLRRLCLHRPCSAASRVQCLTGSTDEMPTLSWIRLTMLLRLWSRLLAAVHQTTASAPSRSSEAVK
jgi:hypothetical protein